MTRRFIDLNADLGEGLPEEAQLLAAVTSANIACGGHAGDARSMTVSLQAARVHGVACGAHPSLPDREGFGRRERPITAPQAYDLVRAQTGALAALARDIGLTLSHVKPHGALYNMAARDPALARAVARATLDAGVGRLYGLAGSHSITAARELGLQAVGEAFADRSYTHDGALVPRTAAGALLGHTAAIEQALGIALRGQVVAVTGERVPVAAATLCLHGDGAGAPALAAHLRKALQDAGVEVQAP